MTDRDFAQKAALILHYMALENKGWRRWFRRWFVHHEPLRNDAANLLREYRCAFLRPITTDYVGGSRHD